jgi:CRISPR/Cas system CSM-associated protein Csm4 (group 5 of RAMP superfamily)
MIYIKDQRATIWKVENKGNYTLVTLSTSRKDKTTNEYKNSNWSFVRFVGSAHDKASDLAERDRIVIKGGGISQEAYMKDGVKTYPQRPQIVVFEFEMNENSGGNSPVDTPPETESDEQLPF